MGVFFRRFGVRLVLVIFWSGFYFRRNFRGLERYTLYRISVFFRIERGRIVMEKKRGTNGLEGKVKYILLFVSVFGLFRVSFVFFLDS